MAMLLSGVLGWLIGAVGSSAVIITCIEVYYRRQAARDAQAWREIFAKQEER